MIPNKSFFGDPSVASHLAIFAQRVWSAQEVQRFSVLTDIIESLENFQNFEPGTRAAVIALSASNLGISQMHFYVIEFHAGLGGACDG